MDKKIRIGAVSYLNTRPLIYGLREPEIAGMIELETHYPAELARMLMADRLDVALLPVAIIPQLSEYHLISDHCIGCTGKVASVAIFSEVPMEGIRTILLDYQSRTSVALARILMRDHWKNPVRFLPAVDDGFMNEIAGTTAGLVIGDRAFEQAGRSAYMYDLGEAWVQHTGLPFVFATWVSNKKLDDGFIKAFNSANAVGVRELDKVIAENPQAAFDLHDYYYRNMSYDFDERKKKGMQLFLDRVASL